MRTSNRKTLGVIAAVALAISMLAGTSASAQQMKGAEHLLHSNAKTKADAEALKPGDSIAMACTKCKSVMTHNVTTEKGHIKVMTIGEKHMCPGCKSTITVVGVGKGAKDEVKHVCEACGDDSVFCCATKPGSGATKGMKKDK